MEDFKIDAFDILEHQSNPIKSNFPKFLPSLLVYVIVLILVYKAVSAEKLDMYCPPEIKKYCEECGDGKGKFYVKNKGSDKDSVDELLTKISNGASYHTKTVKWRRSLILAFFASIGIVLIVLRKFIEGYEFMLMVLIIFVLIYGSFSYYKFHYDKFPIHNIKKNVELIREKLGMKPQEMQEIQV